MVKVSFELNIVPRAKQSTRFGSRGCYTPKDLVAYQNGVGWEAKIAMMAAGLDLFTETVQTEIVFRVPDLRKRDIDNLEKAINDAMNGIVYEDDRQVVKVGKEIVIDRKTPGIRVTVKAYKQQEVLYG